MIKFVLIWCCIVGQFSFLIFVYSNLAEFRQIFNKIDQFKGPSSWACRDPCFQLKDEINNKINIYIELFIPKNRYPK